MLCDSASGFIKPFPVLCQRGDFSSAKKLVPVGGRFPKRLEQSRFQQNNNFMGLESQNIRRLIYIKTGWQPWHEKSLSSGL
jgi:hypothetical protein